MLFLHIYRTDIQKKNSILIYKPILYCKRIIYKNQSLWECDLLF